jgi:hypothetical protein
VYLAEDTATHAQVALKILPKKFAANPEFLSRFKREARAALNMHHENIVGAVAQGEDHGLHYYAMEYVDGEPLDAMLARVHYLPLGNVTQIVTQVARGLEYAHGQGIVHRDIKPGNIFMTQSGVAKILDMGLSKDLTDDALSYNTVSGAVLGTAHYISPEQARGEKTIDGRADIYSLGATFYTMLTGRTPFQGATPALVMMKHLSEHLPDPREVFNDIPEGLVLVLRRMMAKEPADRYRDCGELLRDLERVQTGQSPLSAPLDDSRTTLTTRRPQGDTATTMKRQGVLEPLPPKKTLLWAGIGAGLMAALIAVTVLARRNAGSESGAPKTGPSETSAASRTILAQNFDALDLAALPAGWEMAPRGAFSLIKVEGRGQVLKIAGGQAARLYIPLDVEKMRGRSVRCYFVVRGARAMPEFPAGIYCMLTKGDQKGIDHTPPRLVEEKDGWATFECNVRLVSEDTEPRFEINWPADAGDILVDDLLID